MQAAKHKAELGYRLVLTVWETIPFLDAYRNVRTRPYRRRVLAEHRPVPGRHRARAAGACCWRAPPAARIRVCCPGRGPRAARVRRARGRRTAEHLIVSAGRLVWEKGHQDVLRAVAALRRGIVDAAGAPRAC